MSALGLLSGSLMGPHRVLIKRTVEQGGGGWGGVLSSNKEY